MTYTSKGSSQLQEASKDEPCLHCGKPDWCYRVGELTVCKRGAEPVAGWEATSKVDKEGTPYYAPIQQKALRPKSRKEFVYYNRDDGNLLVKVTRIDDGQGERQFYQSHWDGRGWINGLPSEVAQKVPIYRYKEVRLAIAAGKPIFFVEGEGCADALRNIGLTATTTLGGSKKYRSYGNYTQDLAGANLILCPDRDEPGVYHMAQVAEDFPDAKWLYAPPSDFYWSHLPKAGGLDVADWIANGATVQDILASVYERKVQPAIKVEQATSSTQRDSKRKTIGELEKEILAAATSPKPKLSLTRVAAANNLPYTLVEQFANSLLEDQEIDDQYDLQRQEYMDCLNQIRDLELKVTDPGERTWKLQGLARKYRRSVNELRDSYAKSLVVQHVSEPISMQSLKEQYGEGREWLMRGWIPKASQILLHAQGGIGKTLFINHLIKHVAAGLDWDEYKVRHQGGVLYIQNDTSPTNLIENLKQAGITEELPILFHTTWQMDYTAQLYQWVERYRPALVVIDSLTSANRFSTVSENDMEYAKPVLMMGDMAREFGTTFLYIHHSNGEGQVRGTKAIRNAVDEVWRLEPVDPKNPTNTERILAMEKSRSRMPMRYKLRFNDDDYSWENLGLDGEDETTQNMSGRRLIVNHMEKNRGVRFVATDLAEALRIPEATIRRELPNLFREGLIDREHNPKFTGGRAKGESKHFFLITA